MNQQLNDDENCVCSSLIDDSESAGVSLRYQVCWGAIAAVCTWGFYLSLGIYTHELDNPAPLLWGMFAAHVFRLFYAVRYDLHRHAVKIVGLLSIAAVAGVWLAMVIRPSVIGMVLSLEAEPDLAPLTTYFEEYLHLFHNKVFGIPACFVASYFLAYMALRYLGAKVSFLKHPRSTYEVLGAFYDTAEHSLSHAEMTALISDTRSSLSSTQGEFKVPSPKRLL